MHRKVIIIGSGPAAHTAAIYAGRAYLEPLMFEGFMAAGIPAGGQLTTTTDVENYPGFPDGVKGPVLMENMRKQSIKCGTTIITETIDKVDLSRLPFLVGTEGGDVFTCDSLIIATGAIAKRLNLPGENEFWQKGVSACAVCDGPLPMFRNQPLIVIGGGDSASEEATYLSKYASVVYVLVRKSELKASGVMRKRLLDNPKIIIRYNTIAISLQGEHGGNLTSVVVKNLLTTNTEIINAKGLFYAIGHTPNTTIFNKQLTLDDFGYIKTRQVPGVETSTSVPGVFACGDVKDYRYRQAITAAGSGCMAAMDAEHFLTTI